MREKDRHSGGHIGKEKKKMERTPRPEMGRERGRRRSVTRVSRQPDTFYKRTVQIYLLKFLSYIYLNIYMCMFVLLSKI